jgi:hypothetical protein
MALFLDPKRGSGVSLISLPLCKADRYDCGMERFSPLRMLVSTVIVVIGCATFALPIGLDMTGRASISEELQLAGILAGSAIIGAGFGNVFRRPVVGALCGLSLYLTFCVVRVVFFGK